MNGILLVVFVIAVFAAAVWFLRFVLGTGEMIELLREIRNELRTSNRKETP